MNLTDEESEAVSLVQVLRRRLEPGTTWQKSSWWPEGDYLISILAPPNHSHLAMPVFFMSLV